MALDTRYRPLRYSDVVGQQHTIRVLQQLVATGRAFHQSYIFAGHWGSGKTTLARILARAMLCNNAQHGDPCDECDSCKAFLSGGSPEGYTEVDAATNSGKADVKKILEEIDYSTFSGGRRVYVLDEAHQLSKDALDALLKPLEDTEPGSDNKRLVCIFCTTEPDKVRPTILSRCAAPFVIQVNSPAQIAGRLSFVCQQEGISATQDALELIASATNCHIRDALKTLEGCAVDGAGEVVRETVLRYLHLDRNDEILELLHATLNRQRDAVGQRIPNLTTLLSPGQIAERLSEAAVLAYQVARLRVNPAPHWNRELLTTIGQHADVLRFAQYCAERPSKLTTAMLSCELLLWAEGLQVAVPSQAPSPAPTVSSADLAQIPLGKSTGIPGSKADPSMFAHGKGRDIKEVKPTLSIQEFQALLRS